MAKAHFWPDQPAVPFLLPLTMSKRGEDLTRIRVTKVKKRKGVGSCTITVLESDEDDSAPMATSDYARVTKIRIGPSGKAEGTAVSRVPILEKINVRVHAPLETDTSGSMDVVPEDVALAVPAKKKKKENDSVSAHPSEFFGVTEGSSDQDAFLARCAVYRA